MFLRVYFFVCFYRDYSSNQMMLIECSNAIAANKQYLWAKIKYEFKRFEQKMYEKVMTTHLVGMETIHLDNLDKDTQKYWRQIVTSIMADEEDDFDINKYKPRNKPKITLNKYKHGQKYLYESRKTKILSNINGKLIFDKILKYALTGNVNQISILLNFGELKIEAALDQIDFVNQLYV